MYKNLRASTLPSALQDDGPSTGAPTFEQKLKDCEVPEGSVVRFECQVNGNPEPEVEWYKDGEQLHESDEVAFFCDKNGNHKMTIPKVKYADMGEYTVCAENIHGKITCTVRLVIKDVVHSDEDCASESDVEYESSGGPEGVLMKTEDITNYYTIQEEIGKGRYGVIYKCIHNKNGKAYAAKFIKYSKEEEKRKAEQEMNIMKIFRHKRLLRLTDAFQTQQETILVLKLVNGGELFEKVIENEFLYENDVKYYMKQIVEGVHHLHNNEILHLDLKPENIMINASHQIKLIDFGLARKYNPEENLKLMFCTPEFLAPEVLLYDHISLAADMWSVGVIAYVLLGGISPFKGDNDEVTLANARISQWDFDDPVFEDTSDEAKDFIEKLLVLKATDRLTVTKCVSHPWMVRRKDTDKGIKTDRLKVFTERRKWNRRLP